MLAILISSVVRMAAVVQIYDRSASDGLQLKTDYEVSVRNAQSDEPWQQVPVYRCDVDLSKVEQASFAEFDMSGKVTVRVKRCLPFASDSKQEVVVRPLSKGIKTRQVDRETIEFDLDQSVYLSIEYDGDAKHNLHLFANPMLTEHYTGNEPNTINWTGKNAQDVFIQNAKVIFFGPGIHKPKDLPAGDIRIPSNTTVYLAPGAIVKARLIVDHAENVRIVGRGILDHPLRGVEITESKNVLIDGLTVLNPQHYTIFGGHSDGITIRNLKSFSCRSWSDGIDLMCCSNVRINHIFMRNSDDCIALYNHRWWYWGGSHDFDISDATLWADVAHPVQIGVHGDDRHAQGETLSGVRIHDCDVLFAKGNSGALTISCGDNNHIKDVAFDSIRIERLNGPRMIDLRVVFSEKYNRAPGGSISDIHFNHIAFTGDDSKLAPCRMESYDEEHAISHVTFNDITVNGKKLKSLPENVFVKGK